MLHKHSGSYSPLRNSRWVRVYFNSFSWVAISFNRVHHFTSGLLPLWRRSATYTNFPWLTTWLGVCRATSSHLVTQSFKSNECETNDLGQTQVLKVWCALWCSQIVTLSNSTLGYYKTHTISQREVGDNLKMATKLLGTTSNQKNRAWNSSTPRRGPKKLAVSWQLELGTFGYSNLLTISATCTKWRTSGLANPEFFGLALADKLNVHKAICVSLNLLGLI